jgi:hypothetical protein
MDPTAMLPEFLSLKDRIAVFAPAVDVPLEKAVAMISDAIVFCRENGITGLLIDARELWGFPHPTVVDRYWFIRKWAEDSQHKVLISMISRPEMIDPEQIGITIAANAGLTANVFDNETDAREWLVANC